MLHDPTLLQAHRQVQKYHIRRMTVDLVDDRRILHALFTGIGAYHPKLRLHLLAVMQQFLHCLLRVGNDIKRPVLLDQILQHHSKAAVINYHVSRLQCIDMMRCQKCLLSRQKQVCFFQKCTVLLILHRLVQHLRGSKHDDIKMIIRQIFIHFADKDIVTHHIHVNIHNFN